MLFILLCPASLLKLMFIRICMLLYEAVSDHFNFCIAFHYRNILIHSAHGGHLDYFQFGAGIKFPIATVTKYHTI